MRCLAAISRTIMFDSIQLATTLVQAASFAEKASTSCRCMATAARNVFSRYCRQNSSTDYRICGFVAFIGAGAVAKYCDQHVCVSVCPRGYLRNHTRDLYQIFVDVAYGRGSVLIRQGDEIPRERDILGVFLPNDNA